jgi:hypothetical protein
MATTASAWREARCALLAFADERGALATITGPYWPIGERNASLSSDDKCDEFEDGTDLGGHFDGRRALPDQLPRWPLRSGIIDAAERYFRAARQEMSRFLAPFSLSLSSLTFCTDSIR